METHGTLDHMKLFTNEYYNSLIRKDIHNGYFDITQYVNINIRNILGIRPYIKWTTSKNDWYKYTNAHYYIGNYSMALHHFCDVIYSNYTTFVMS